MIEMSENYTPELSEYKEGRVVQLQVVHSTRTTCAPELSGVQGEAGSTITGSTQYKNYTPELS